MESLPLYSYGSIKWLRVFYILNILHNDKSVYHIYSLIRKVHIFKSLTKLRKHCILVVLYRVS